MTIKDGVGGKRGSRLVGAGETIAESLDELIKGGLDTQQEQ